MEVKDKVIVVTGGAQGIGEALCRRFVQEKAGAVVIVDLDEERAQSVAGELSCVAFKADVSIEEDIISVVQETEKQFGPIDLFCSNAGILVTDEPDYMATSCSNRNWQRCWEVNVMAHIYAARAVLPGMIARGEGYLLNSASAAGLLNQIGGASYATTKHAAIGFAENLSITHRDDGIKVSVLCPQAVRTRMSAGDEGGAAAVDGILEPEEVAECVVRGLEQEKFLILPHPEVETYMQRKISDYDRWLKGMSRFRRKIMES